MEFFCILNSTIEIIYSERNHTHIQHAHVHSNNNFELSYPYPRKIVTKISEYYLKQKIV